MQISVRKTTVFLLLIALPIFVDAKDESNWVEQEKILLEKINSYAAQPAYTKDITNISQEIKNYIELISTKPENSSVKRALIRNIYEFIIEKNIPFSFVDQKQAFNLLLEARKPANGSEIESIVYETIILFRIYSSRENQGPIPIWEFESRLEKKISSCGSDKLCKGASYLLNVQRTMSALSLGEFDKARIYNKAAINDLLKTEIQTSLPVLKSFTSIQNELIEFRILRAQNLFQKADLRAIDIQRMLDKVLHLQNQKNLTSQYFEIAWPIESQLLEFQINVGKSDYVRQRIDFLLNNYLNHIDLSDQKSVSKFEAYKALTNSIVARSKNSDDNLFDKNFLEIEDLYIAEHPEISAGNGRKFEALFRLLIKNNFDQKTKITTLSLINNLETEIRRTVDRGDDVPFDDVFRSLDAAKDLALSRSPTLLGSEDQIKKFFESTLDAIFLSMYLLTNSVEASEFNLSSSLTRYDAISGLESPAKQFFFKLYANSLQRIRKQYGSDFSKDFFKFLESHKDKLHAAALFFFETGDYESGEKTYRIIKENEFSQFISLSTRSIDFLNTELTYDEFESGVLRKLGDLRDDIQILIKSYLAVKAPRVDKRKLDIELVILQRTDELKKEFHKLLSKKQIQNETKSSLIPNDLLLSTPVVFVAAGEDKTIFTLREGKRSKIISIDIGRQKLRELVYSVIFSLSNKENNWNSQHQSLEKFLLKPLEKELNFFKSKDILLVPDDALSIMPTSLLISDNSKYRFKAFLNLSTPEKTPYSGLANKSIDSFVNGKGGSGFSPLPSAEKEGKFLTAFPFKNLTNDVSRTLYINEKFTKQNWERSLLGKKSVVHVATHFVLRGASDTQSGLILGNGEILSLRDMAPSNQLKGQIDLLTLSACETAISPSQIVGSSKSVEGMAGFFSALGTKNVIGTLWKVSDQSTYDFMRIFYTLLIEERLDIFEALQRTQMIFRSGGAEYFYDYSKLYPKIFDENLRLKLAKYTHPFYWAPFVLYSLR